MNREELNNEVRRKLWARVVRAASEQIQPRALLDSGYRSRSRNKTQRQHELDGAVLVEAAQCFAAVFGQSEWKWRMEARDEAMVKALFH